jgi:hypothetical protein
VGREWGEPIHTKRKTLGYFVCRTNPLSLVAILFERQTFYFETGTFLFYEEKSSGKIGFFSGGKIYEKESLSQEPRLLH